MVSDKCSLCIYADCKGTNDMISLLESYATTAV